MRYPSALLHLVPLGPPHHARFRLLGPDLSMSGGEP